eukprot:326150-Chlamydomonas_euryale.AAC.1
MRCTRARSLGAAERPSHRPRPAAVTRSLPNRQAAGSRPVGWIGGQQQPAAVTCSLPSRQATGSHPGGWWKACGAERRGSAASGFCFVWGCETWGVQMGGWATVTCSCEPSCWKTL